MSARLDTTTGRAVIPVVHRKRISASFTRPADANAFTIGDVVGPVTTPAVQKLSGCARANGAGGKITELMIQCNEPTVTLGTFRVHLFNRTFTPPADNAAFSSLAAQAEFYQGFVDPPILVADFATASGAVTRTIANGLPLQFLCDAGDTALYAVIVALGAYVPKISEVFRLSIVVEQD